MKSMRLKYYIVILLACSSLISVGFASWVIGIPTQTELSGMIEVEDVIKSSDYITCSPSDITTFSYFKTGFVNANNEITNVGTISANVAINVESCKNKFSRANALEVNFVLNQDNLIAFSSESNMRYSVIVKIGDNEISSITTSNNSMCLTSFVINNLQTLTENVNVTVIYTFEILNQDYFANNVFPIIDDNGFEFTFSAKLTGKEVL